MDYADHHQQRYVRSDNQLVADSRPQRWLFGLFSGGVLLQRTLHVLRLS